jgi:hypothetical protein
MDRELKKSVITVASVELKPTKDGAKKVKIVDSNGLKYTVWEKKADGTVSKAWEGYQNIKVGDVVGVSFDEQEKEFQGDNGPVKYLDRTIRFFSESSDQGEPQF